MTLLEEIVNAKSFIKGFSLYLTTDINASQYFAANDKTALFFVAVNPISETRNDIFFDFCRLKRNVIVVIDVPSCRLERVIVQIRSSIHAGYKKFPS